jgi:ABC-2 type transport system ATP-binding protein
VATAALRAAAFRGEEASLNEDALVLKGIRKAFAGHVAVQDLSLSVPRGCVFGLLGPNGAGKTTTLRMVMNILGADAGTIEILGRPADHAARDRIGYMPEERGLYKQMVLEEQLVFMAVIKGLAAAEAKKRIGPWLERLGLADWRKRKTNELSKGMQQKAQFIATVLHQPDVLIVDEPMSGLDPVGMNVMREVLLELRRAGTTIVLSSHQMETVERLCDRVALINRGEKLLDGSVSEVKARHGKNTVVLAFDGDGSFIEGLPGVAQVSDHKQYLEVRLHDGQDAQPLLREAAARLRLRRFEIVEPSLHDIFVETVTSHGREAA